MTDRDAPPRANWREFFDQVTKDHEGDSVTVEVIGVDYGDQLETEPLPFAYIEYDIKDEAVAVGIGGKDGRFPVVLRHVIELPQTILADSPAPGAARAFDIVAQDGTSTIVTLRPRDALPPPG